VVVGEPRRDQERDQQRAEQDQRAARHAVDQAADHVVRLPMIPSGRNSNTSTRIANANMLLADGVNSSPASASVMPISTPPSSAPGIEPSPPTITIMKASNVNAGPSGGVTSMISTR